MFMTFKPSRFFECNPAWIYLVCSERDGQKTFKNPYFEVRDIMTTSKRVFKFRERTIGRLTVFRQTANIFFGELFYIIILPFSPHVPHVTTV